MFGKGKKADVVVVGAGPVGLFAALLLARRGVKVEIFDMDWRTSAHSYALVLHPGSLRLLDSLGLAKRFIDRGHRIDRVSFMEGDTVRTAADLAGLSDGFPYAMVVPQSYLESTLENLLKEEKVKVGWNHRVENVENQGDHVSVRVSRLEKESLGYPVAHMESVIGKTFDVDCSFVIAADGYHSLVRRRLGIEIETLGDTIYFSLFEFETNRKWEHESRIVLAADSINIFWPMKNGRCRLAFQVEEEPKDRPDIGSLRELAGSRLPWFEDLPPELEWSSPVAFEKRLAKRFGEGRVWLAGDAAHLVEPMGAQSMNIGLREAYDLASRIAGILEGKATRETLEEYNAEREREWQLLLKADQTVAPREQAASWTSANRLRIVPSIPASGPELDELLGNLGLGFTRENLRLSTS